jgi:LmbE family N-acetylglucosaminyl deacetylase
MIGGSMTKRLVVVFAHPDDAEYTMWPYGHYGASGYDVEYVAATRGEVTATSLRLDGGVGGAMPCLDPQHPYVHNHVQEQFELPTVEQIGLARLAECYSAAGAFGMVAPTIPTDPGFIHCHEKNLGTAYGSSGSGSSTAPTTQEGVDKAEVVFRDLIEEFPNSIFWTHSPTDRHPDHAALGKALRKLKGTPIYNGAGVPFTYTGGDPILSPLLVNSFFWVSKLYWSVPAGQPGSRMAEYCAWYPNIYPDNTKVLARRAEYTAWIKAHVIPCLNSWNPAGKSYAIGTGHSTPSQAADCFGAPPPFVASALWHP